MEKKPSPAIIAHFAVLEDPRIERHKRHKLSDIVVSAVCAVRCGAESFPASADCGQRRYEQQFPVKDLEVGGVTIRGTDAVPRGHKGSRPRRILCQQPLGQRESDAFCCQERPCRQTSPQTLIR